METVSVADRQAAEARELAELRQMLSAPSDGYPAGAWCEAANRLLEEVDALSVRLAQECALRAQAEQERDTSVAHLERAEQSKLALSEMVHRERERAEKADARLRVTDALKREYENALTFADVRTANTSRAKRWHPGFPVDDDWSGADWSNAMCGEAGEAANVVKKLRRHETGHHGALDGDESELRAALAKELADVLLYADLLATKYGIDLAAVVAAKFNEVSERQGFPERLPVVAASGGREAPDTKEPT